jgi:hypothetical protein
MRRTPSILALSFALAACGLLGVVLALELRAAVPDATPRAAIEAAAADRRQARQDEFAKGDRSWDVAFDEGMVRDKVTWKSAGYPETTDLTVVNATPDADLAPTAKACAEFIGDDARVQCYVFASTEAYEYKNISGDLASTTPTPIANLCYMYRATTTRAGGPITITDMRDAAALWKSNQCPASWDNTAAVAR